MEDSEQTGERAYHPARKADGTFAKGSTGNPNGRPVIHPKRHRLPMDNAQAITDLAEMPVTMMIDGEAIQTSAYDAALRKLYNRAMNNDMRAMKIFLDQTRDAAASRVYHSELVRTLIHKDNEEQQVIEKIMERFPINATGVHHPLDDGTPVHWKVYETIKKLEQLEAKEEELRLREVAIRSREAQLDGK